MIITVAILYGASDDRKKWNPLAITPPARAELVRSGPSARPRPPVFGSRRRPSPRRTFPGGPAAWTCTWPAGRPGRLPGNGTRPAGRLPRPPPQGPGGSGPTRRRRRRARRGSSKRSRATSCDRVYVGVALPRESRSFRRMRRIGDAE